MKNTKQIGQNRNIAIILRNPFKLVIESPGSEEGVIFFLIVDLSKDFFL